MRSGLARVTFGLPALALVTATVVAQSQTPPPETPSAGAQQPVFKATTDVIAIDVAVTTDKGDVVPGLTADDFILQVDGKPRRVVSAQFLQDTGAKAASTATSATSSADSFSSNEAVTGGRLVLLVFDLEGMAPAGGRDAARAAGAFLDQLTAIDQVGLMALPNGVSVPFTADRARIHEALDHITGQGATPPNQQHLIGLSEAYEIASNNSFALARVIERECAATRNDDPFCREEVNEQARTMAELNRQRSDTAIRSLEALIEGLRKIEAPKILVVISGGIPVQFGEFDTGVLSAVSAASRSTVYVVHLDSETARIDAAQAKLSPTQLEDRAVNMHGLEILAGSTRGTVFSSTGDGTLAFQRIAREIAAYYLLSAESEPVDRDGRTHAIKVSVSRPGVTVRARREFISPTAATATARFTPEQEVAAVLQSPLTVTGLALRVATYSLRAPVAGKVRVLIASDIGRAESGPLEATVGYVVMSPYGKPVLSAFDTTTAQLMDKETAGPVHSTIAVDLVPGKYRLKLAIVDKNGRRGSVEHNFEASLSGAGGLEVGDLLLTPPIIADERGVRLTAAPVAEGRALDAYVEMYGGGRPETTKVAIEVADSDTAPVLATIVAPVSEGRDKSRLVAEAPLPLGLLPPGTYVARALISSGGGMVKRARQFRVSRGVPANDVFKGELADTVGAFDPKSVLVASLVRPAVARAIELDEKHAGPEAAERAARLSAGSLDPLDQSALPSDDASLLASFLRGLSLYRVGKIEDASGEFRAAVRASPDFIPGVFYLGACYAAGGNFRQAIGAWQTALIGDDPLPEVYELVADGYLRLGDAEQAAGLMQEAGARWPEDARFAIKVARARAANGHLTEALAGLKPVLDVDHPNAEALALAVRLAVANVATSEDQASAGSTLRDLTGKLKLSGVEVPPLATRWLTYLDRK